MLKRDLRKQFLAQRKALPAEEVERRSLAIGEGFLSAAFVIPTQEGPFDSGNLKDPSCVGMTKKTIHTFLPIARQNEVNTWPIIHQIWREFPEMTVVVSVTDPVSQTLTHHEFTPETQLIENRWGIPEPVNSGQQRSDVSAATVRRFGSEQLDVVLVPLLAFDLRGHRVGYGGGYYDRFLAECRPNCLKIGLSLFEPVELIDDIEGTDVLVDACITPERVFVF
jgi:5-formyltetrahydrofolate cyclo-ligase